MPLPGRPHLLNFPTCTSWAPSIPIVKLVGDISHLNHHAHCGSYVLTLPHPKIVITCLSFCAIAKHYSHLCQLYCFPSTQCCHVYKMKSLTQGKDVEWGNKTCGRKKWAWVEVGSISSYQRIGREKVDPGKNPKGNIRTELERALTASQASPRNFSWFLPGVYLMSTEYLLGDVRTVFS